MIIWLTGQPGAGKTTICNWVKENHDTHIFHIDGDDLREIFDNKDYSENGRRKNIELAQSIAHYLHNKGFTVLVSLVSPYLDQREAFKQKMKDNILEVWVHTTDIRGRENYFVQEYQAPQKSFLDLNTTNTPVAKSAGLILQYLENLK